MKSGWKVLELEQRYGIARSAVYERLKRLRIQPRRHGRHSYLTQDELEQMDKLNEFILSGGTISEYVDDAGIDPVSSIVNQLAYEAGKTRTEMSRKLVEEALRARGLL